MFCEGIHNFIIPNGRCCQHVHVQGSVEYMFMKLMCCSTAQHSLVAFVLLFKNENPHPFARASEMNQINFG